MEHLNHFSKFPLAPRAIEGPMPLLQSLTLYLAGTTGKASFLQAPLLRTVNLYGIPDETLTFPWA
jgi:hypothetical protein